MLLVILGSCAPGPSRTPAPLTGSPENAEAAVRDWLTDRAGRAPDYGWSRLHPAVRTEIYAGDRAAYEQEAREVETGLWGRAATFAPSNYYPSRRLTGRVPGP